MLLLQQMLVLFIYMMLGFFLARKGILDERAGKTFSWMVVNVANPALIILPTINKETTLFPEQIWEALKLAVIMYVALIVIAKVITMFMRTSMEKNLYQMMVIFNNIAFMGFPIVAAARAVVLGHIGGKGIAEVLHRHVGKGVDLDSRCKSRHDHGAEAVDQPLYHEDAEIHDGLLHAGHHRKVQDGGKVLFVPPAVLFFRAELRELFQGVQSDADARHELREGGGGRGPLHAPVPHQHAHQVQDHIEHCRHSQEQQRHHGVADGPQKVCKVVIQKGGRDTQKNDAEIFLHQEDELFRHTQHPQDAIQPQVHQHIERHRHARDEHEGLEHALPHAVSDAFLQT